MASQEQLQLAGFIKKVHLTLRYESQKYGADVAWNAHCNQIELLNKYADAMKQLATTYWDANAAAESSKAKSRIQWVSARCIEYFLEGGKLSERIREENKMKSQQASLESRSFCTTQQDTVADRTDSRIGLPTCDVATSKMHLLDVGSCYNPFKIFPFFEVLPIDIAPASPDVYQCDFLNVQVVETEDSHELVEEKCVITRVQSNSFDIVVFSLLLEYMPCAEQRYSCCLKAYSLLKPEGLLFIITPDSKNPSANAPLMKSWRVALSYLGFIKVYYEKLPHIHCMAYRKALCPELAKKLWVLETQTKSSRAANPKVLMAIPQDLHNYNGEETLSRPPFVKRTDKQDETLKEMFQALPLFE